MYIEITGTHPEKPTITVEFFNNGISLLCLEGTTPFIRKGLTLEKTKEVIINAGYSIKIEEIS